MELQGQLPAIRARGLGVAAVLYEPSEVLKRFADKFGIEFPLLADVGSSVIKRYGILNTSATGDRAGIPYPGTFILDPQERVVARFFEQAYQERFTSSDILVRLEGPGPAGHVAQELTTPQLSVRTWPSDEVVAPGERFGLVLDVSPKPGIHVYAPGQEGYLPVTITLGEDSAYKAHPLDYPQPQIYDFKPLDERVKVYERPFRLVQELTVSLSPEMRARSAQPDASLTVRGTFRYQACDDQVCFMPAALSVEWTVRLRPLLTPDRRPR